MSMKALRKALKDKKVDKFDVGTVIRWKSAGVYNYAAIKAGNGKWYTTAASFNSFVSQILDFDDLVEVLSRAETDEIDVSLTWERLDQ